jgi:hypothetical protein
MRKLLSFGLLPPLLYIAAVSSLAQPQEPGCTDVSRIEDRLAGAWRLVWLEEPDAGGNVHKADCIGLLVYTRDGHMSVQVMYRNPEAAGRGGPVQYAEGGYEASFGTYKISENTHTFTFHVEGAVVRSLLGKDLSRAFEMSGKQLVVKSTDPKERWRAAWERY